MNCNQYAEKVNMLYNEATARIKEKHIGCFKGMDKPLFLISDTYPGVWLEHTYDAYFYSLLEPEFLSVAKNTINLFIDNQKPNGQLPCYIWDGNKVNLPDEKLIGWTQIQECVSFYSICFKLYELSEDKELLIKCYNSGLKWIDWLYKNRMSMNKGLIEMFCGYDTGHDNSGRFQDLSFKTCHTIDGKPVSADVAVTDEVMPLITPDMNAVFYGDIIALSKMAKSLGESKKSGELQSKAKKVKELILSELYDSEDKFFYDVDKNGNKRKYLSCSVFSLFSEGVLDKESDKAIIDAIYNEHLKNKNEFWTEFPIPSMAINDPSTKTHKDKNCWGYYSQALTALRCTLWMDNYGYKEDLDHILLKWQQLCVENFQKGKFCQEADPKTGEFTDCSQWYSSAMLLFIYSVKRLLK